MAYYIWNILILCYKIYEVFNQIIILIFSIWAKILILIFSLIYWDLKIFEWKIINLNDFHNYSWINIFNKNLRRVLTLSIRESRASDERRNQRNGMHRHITLCIAFLISKENHWTKYFLLKKIFFTHAGALRHQTPGMKRIDARVRNFNFSFNFF